MATVKLDREDAPDFDEAQDVSYEEGADPDFDETAQVDYEEVFPDAAEEAGNQEWRARKQK